jgi:outer membrane lipase/esterase
MPSSTRPARRLLALALAAAAAPAFAQSGYSDTIFFGDSLTDSGHFRPALVQAVGPSGALVGRFTTNPGLVWAEFMAEYYGTAAVSANQGGTNYAVGGARTGTNTAGALGPIPSLATQFNSYLASRGGSADPNALYTVWGGANDLFAVAAGAPAAATIGAAVTSQVTIIGGLQQAGARYVLVPTIPDLGRTPQFLSQGAVGSAAGTALATSYNNALFGGLATAGLRVISLDTFTLIQEISAAPATYGFTNVTGTACGAGSSLTCSPANYVVPTAAETYAFADGVHPTTGAHRIIGQYAVSILEAPRQVALLPQSATVIGRSRAERVATHVGAAPEADGMRWWGGVRADSQRYDDGDLYEGIAPAGLFGVDFSRGNVVFGAYGGFGSVKQELGRNAGEFKQSDATLGGFVGWYGEQAWVSGQLSYSWLDFDVDREVMLGAATRRHSASTDGTNLSAGISAGFEFGDGAFRHGPVVSLLSQTIEVDGFTEGNPSSTALVYSDQEVDSLIASAGWQASYAISDSVRPYARVTYDRELEKPAEQVFAQVQTLPGVAPYAVPGLDLDRKYATVLLGARTRAFGLDADVGLTSTVGQKSANDVTAFITLGGSF